MHGEGMCSVTERGRATPGAQRHTRGVQPERLLLLLLLGIPEVRVLAKAIVLRRWPRGQAAARIRLTPVPGPCGRRRMWPPAAQLDWRCKQVEVDRRKRSARLLQQVENIGKLHRWCETHLPPLMEAIALRRHTKELARRRREARHGRRARTIERSSTCAARRLCGSGSACNRLAVSCCCYC